MSTKEKCEAEIADAEDTLRIEGFPVMAETRTYISALESLLAESYAPCRECGEPPQAFYGIVGRRQYALTHCRNEFDGKTLAETRAAWNAANREKKP